jgi:hypothetical protein
MIVPLQDCQEKNIRTQAMDGPFFRPQKIAVRRSNAVRLDSLIVAAPEEPAVPKRNGVGDGTWPETWYGAMLLPQSIYLLNAVLSWLSRWTQRTKRR